MVTPLLRELLLHSSRLGALDRRKPEQARLVGLLLDLLAVAEDVPLALTARSAGAGSPSSSPSIARERRPGHPGRVRRQLCQHERVLRSVSPAVRTLADRALTRTVTTIYTRRSCRVVHPGWTRRPSRPTRPAENTRTTPPNPPIVSLIRRCDQLAALRTSGSAVFVCSLTTMIGYGSLLVSENLAIRGFGTASLIGEVTTVLNELVLVPALLAVGPRSARRGHAS